MWFLLTLQFGEQRARQESIQIKFGDIAWKKDECGGFKHPGSCPFWGFQLKSLSCHFGSETPPPLNWVFRRRRLEQKNIASKFYTVDLFFFTVSLSCNKFRWHLPKWERLLQFLSGYLYFSVYKQVVVVIHFTGLPNELREIIGSLKMHTKRSSAVARGLVPPKKWKKKIVVIW